MTLSWSLWKKNNSQKSKKKDIDKGNSLISQLYYYLKYVGNFYFININHDYTCFCQRKKVFYCVWFAALEWFGVNKLYFLNWYSYLSNEYIPYQALFLVNCTPDTLNYCYYWLMINCNFCCGGGEFCLIFLLIQM